MLTIQVQDARQARENWYAGKVLQVPRGRVTIPLTCHTARDKGYTRVRFTDGKVQTIVKSLAPEKATWKNDTPVPWVKVLDNAGNKPPVIRKYKTIPSK